jgi:Fe-S cluster assembly protein SufD
MSLLDQLRSTALPTADEEIWRYSRIGELDLTAFTPSTHRCQISAHDELFAPATVGIDLFPDDRPDVFATLNAESGETTHLVVPAGMVVEQPILITHHIPGEGVMTFPRLVVEAGRDSQVTVIERFVSVSDGPALTIPVVQIRAAEAARVQYLAVNELSTEVWSIGHQQAIGERDSTTLLATVTLGGDYARVRTEARLVGSGASTRQVALYFAGDEQMHDFRTIQRHEAPHTNSDLLFKGAVQDHARSVYTGLIDIAENAKGTVAFQTNRNLTLSEGAWAESVPNLDIRTNDVKCSHASTVGPIDEDQRFYLESRGIRPEIAERLVVLGFFDEVLDQLPASTITDEIRDRVAAKLHLGDTTEGGE